MNKLYFRHCFLVAVAMATGGAVPAAATSIYNNTTTDTGITVFYSANAYTRIGDTIHLSGTDRVLTNAVIQLYNAGDAGTFDAILSFWNTGSPVGTQLGSSYSLTGLDIDSLVSKTIQFSGLDLLVPDDIVVTIGIDKASIGLDLGPNFFDPPSDGSSDSAQLVVDTGTGFSTSAVDNGTGNMYLSLDATSSGIATPEPASGLLMASGLLIVRAAALLWKRRQTVR